MKRETKFMFLIIAPHNGETKMFLTKCMFIAIIVCSPLHNEERTKCMFLIIAPHNEERN